MARRYNARFRASTLSFRTRKRIRGVLNFARFVQRDVAEIGDRRALHSIDNVAAVFYDQDLWPVAIHESAHLVAGWMLGLEIRGAEIDEVGGHSHITFSRGRLRDYLVKLLAGEVAEEEVFGRQVLPRVHTGSDRERLYLAVARAGPTGQQELFVARQKVKKLVHTHRGTIIRLATELPGIATDAGLVIDGDALAALLGADGSGLLRRTAV